MEGGKSSGGGSGVTRSSPHVRGQMRKIPAIQVAATRHDAFAPVRSLGIVDDWANNHGRDGPNIVRR